METKRTEAEINELANQAQDKLDEGVTKFFGMSYEDGIVAVLQWLRNVDETFPMDD